MRKKTHFEYKGYIGSIHYSRKDKYYNGRVLGLTKILLSYGGTSMSTLETDFKRLIDEYLDECKKELILPHTASYRIIVNITEFTKHIAMYLELARVREIIITRFQGEKMEFFGVKPINMENIECEDLYRALVESDTKGLGLQVIKGKEKADLKKSLGI